MEPSIQQHHQPSTGSKTAVRASLLANTHCFAKHPISSVVGLAYDEELRELKRQKIEQDKKIEEQDKEIEELEGTVKQCKCSDVEQ